MLNKTEADKLDHFGAIDCTQDENAPPRLIIPATPAPPPTCLYLGAPADRA